MKTMIGGLQYIQDFIDVPAAQALLAVIEAQPWLADLKRAVQHYGYKYDYKTRSIDQSMYLGPLPTWADDLANRLHSRGLLPRLADQSIVNQYLPGQGISPHVDCTSCFDGSVACVSLGSGISMDFTNVQVRQKVSKYLERRSVIAMAGEARYAWRHSIAARKSDEHGGQRVKRERRISLTFRNVLLATPQDLRDTRTKSK